ncbi:MAG: PA2779 family protein [Acidobacteria bacterium]|nr:PA2779 family protein [Acidobacteriota bacterium]
MSIEAHIPLGARFMYVGRAEWIRSFLTFTLVVVCLFPPALLGETVHVVSSAELQLEAARASQDREQNIAKVRKFISGPAGSETLAKAHIDGKQVQSAVAELNDQELAQLAARADQAQRDFAAGNLSTRDIALIILGVVLIILLVIVVR